MERRTFIKGAFGLTVLVAGAGLGIAGMRDSVHADDAVPAEGFTTPDNGIPADAVGPVMEGGIDLVASSDPNVYEGYLSTTQLFRVDKSGAALMMLADGTRTIGEIAAQASQTLGEPVDAADAAEFFVTLGQEGYLQNEVLVNLLEIAG